MVHAVADGRNVAEGGERNGRGRGAGGAGREVARTLQLLREDAVVLLAERPLLLIHRTANNVLHLVHGEEHLARERVDALPQLLDVAGAEVAGAGALCEGVSGSGKVAVRRSGGQAHARARGSHGNATTWRPAWGDTGPGGSAAAAGG